jgi:hypothetical protein
MAAKFDFKTAFSRLIERTHDPMAPIKLQEAHKYVDIVAKMLVHNTNRNEVRTYQDALLSYWTDDAELERICGSPAFLIAISSLYVQCLVEYAKETHDGVRDDQAI